MAYLKINKNIVGKLGITETSPAYKIHVKTTDGGTQPTWDDNNDGARNLGLFETGENEGAVTIFLLILE